MTGKLVTSAHLINSILASSRFCHRGTVTFASSLDPDLDPICGDTLIVFQKEFSFLKKINKSMKNYPACRVLIFKI